MLTKLDKELLFEAAENNDLPNVKRFIEKKDVPLNITNDWNQTLAHVAIGKNGLGVVKYVIEKDPSILARLDNDNYSLLHKAVEKGDIDVVKYLCEVHDAKIKERNRRDLARTAVQTAVQFGHLNIVKYFIDERGVNANMTDEWIDKPPVFLAVQYRHRDVLEYLMEEKNADITPVDFFGENILFTAVKAGDLDFMKKVLDEKRVKFNLNSQNQNNETLAFKAVTLNQTEILKYLVDQKRVDVNIPEKWEKATCLHKAAAQNNLKLCKYLIAHGANIRCRDRLNQTPVQKATDENLIEYMRSITAKIRASRSVAYSPFEPVSAIFYVSPQYRRLGERFSSEVDHSGGEVDGHGGNIFLGLFSAAVGTLFATPARLFSIQSSVSPQASIERRMDPIAEDAVFSIYH